MCLVCQSRVVLSDIPDVAGPTSADGTPSLAAVVASIGPDFMQFPCSMELQTTGLEVRLLSVWCLRLLTDHR